MRARIRYEGFDRAESEKLRSFLWIANHFARRWNRTVILDAPHGQQELVSLDTADEDKRVYIHFFCPPPTTAAFPTVLGYAKELFHLQVPHDDLTINGEGPLAWVTGNDVAARFVSKRANFLTINAPEGRAVAQIAKNHIFILPDLAHRPWDGAGVVFWEILEMASRQYDSEGKPSERFRHSLQAHEMMRSRTIRLAEKLKKDFARISGLVAERERAASVAELRAKREAMLLSEAEFGEAAARVEIIKEVMQGSKEDEELSQERLLEEFEVILRYPRVLGLRVEGDELHVYTRPIEHVMPNGERHMLGQYKIIIQPQETRQHGNVLEAVKMAEWGWLGPYRHAEWSTRAEWSSHAGSPIAPCFGATYVTSIKKSLLDHDYQTLIQQLIHYLDSDSRQPFPRAVPSREQYEEKPFYANDYERQNVALSYADFVRRHREVLRKKVLQEERSRAETEEQEKADAFQRARAVWILAGYRARFLEHLVSVLPIEEELNKVFAVPSFSTMMIGADFIWVVFGPGKGFDKFREMWFPGTFRIMILPLQGKVRIWGRGSDFEDGFVKEQLSINKIPQYLAHLNSCFLRGMFGTAITFIHEVLRGRAVFDEEALNKVEIGEDRVREFLLQEFSQPQFTLR